MSLVESIYTYSLFFKYFQSAKPNRRLRSMKEVDGK